VPRLRFLRADGRRPFFPDSGMSGALFPHTGAQRGGLFGFVTGAHLLFLASALSLANAPVLPANDRVIMVDLLPMAPGPLKIEEPQTGPGPAAQPVVQPEPEPEPPPPEPEPEPEPEPPEPPPVPEPPVVQPPPKPKRPRKPVVKAPRPPVAAEPVPFVPVSATPASGGAPNNAPAGSSRPSTVASGGAVSGSGEEPARFDADYLRNPKPPYPLTARRMREEGKVILRVLVTSEGAAGSLEIKTSSGSARLDESALRTVRQWKFIPARRGNTPVQSWVLVPIVFKLEQ
jgi:protein TonB